MARVLVVEDDDSSRGLIIRILMHDGYTVDVAADGESAIDKLRENDYDALVLDFMMPRVDGAGVVDYLISEKPDMLVHTILCTAYGEVAEHNERLRLVRSIVRKPLEVAELLLAVTSALTEPDNGGR